MHTLGILSILQSKNKSLILFLIIPLSLSAFTHMWNPLGFPTFHVDEGHYMRRTMQVLEGLGPQETKETYEYGYDHPFFGQIFLAATLSLINYPDSLDPSVSLHSIEMLYLVPRLLMGILAVIDTFLIYKIAESRYNRNIAFFSAILFAVMPLSGMLRGILLDSIELPFILLSILFAIYYSKTVNKTETTHNSNSNSNSIDKNIMLLLLSGIFLGLAIFTKVPIVMMIPLLAFIILERHMPVIKRRITITKRLKTLVIWFIPVTVIAFMWPAYAISVGQFDDWMDGILYQTGRQGGNANLLHSINIVTQIDPVLVILGIISVIYIAIKKDFFALIWMLPYLIFLYLIGWVVYFHWSVFIPILCIALGILIERLRERFAAHKYIRLLPLIFMSTIAVFGLVSFTLLSTANLNTTYTNVYYFVTQELHHNIENKDKQEDIIGTTIIGGHRIRALVWIPKYIFHDAVTFRDTDLPNDNFTKPIQTSKFIVVADSSLLSKLVQIKPDVKFDTIGSLYYYTSHTIATFIDMEQTKNSLLDLSENHGLGKFVEIKANY